MKENNIIKQVSDDIFIIVNIVMRNLILYKIYAFYFNRFESILKQS